MKNFNLIALTLATTLTACGSHKDAASASDSLLLSDTQVAGQTAAAQVDVATSAAAEENDAAAGAGLTADVQLDFKRSRTCTAQGDDALVDVVQSITRDFSLDLPRRSAETKFESYVERKRTWSRKDGSVACAADGKHAGLKPDQMAGVSLDALITESRQRSVSVTNKRTGTTASQSFKYSLSGTRHVDWTSADAKTVTQDLARTLDVTPKNGNGVTLTAEIKNADGAPLQIVVERDKASLAVLSREVQSGTLEAVHKDGTRVETVFKNVVYKPAQGCLAVSGEIDGSVFKDGETTASLTYKIDFTDGAGQIQFSNGESVDYTADGCALDEPADKAVDVDDKSQVTPPAGV